MFNYRPVDLGLLKQFRNYFSLPSRSVHTLDISVKVEQAKKMANFDVEHAILRHEPGSDKFSFSFMLANGKMSNFNRMVDESISTFEQRIVSNIAKRYKTNEVTAKLQLPSELQDETLMKTILDHLLANSMQAKFQINNGHETDILFNPPEISLLKFYNKAFVGYPVMPRTIEGSSNFVLEKSDFKWKYSKDPIIVANALKPKKSTNQTKLNIEDTPERWTELDSKSMIVVPTPEMIGSLLRLTMTPSDGKSLGFPLTVDFPSLVVELPVSQLLYEERLARLAPHDTKDPTTLRFVSYNILADTYATPEWFSACPPTALEYDYRSPLICKELESYNADVMCLQEVDDKVYNGILEPFLKVTRNLHGLFSRKSLGTKEGVATFFNPDKLEVLESETIDVGNQMQSLPFYNVLPEILTKRIEERNTIFQISVFENKNPEKSLLILGNTHLYFHPNADHIRLLQSIVCITTMEQKLEELKKKFPDRKIRIFFCGDLNCTPPYGAFRLLTTGKVKADAGEWTSHEPEKISPGIDYEHGLKLQNSHTGEELTNIVVNFEGCIDYILYQPEHAQVSSICPAPTKSTIASIIGKPEDQISLPAYCSPSDHLPVITDFKLL